MNPKKHLGFASLYKGLSSLFYNLPDRREELKVDYSIHDAMMSAFACMYFQDPSLLQFQERLQEYQNRHNLQTLFGVSNIPKDTQLRNIVDNVESNLLRPIFKDYFCRLQRGKHLLQYQLFEGLYICSIDGSQYFHSNSIHCPGCLTATHENGEISYSHKVLQAAIMHPDMRQVIPLMPEEIKNTDGNTKQDCEVNAAKRLIPKIKKDHPRLGLIITGDDLFSKQPFIEEVLGAGYHFIFIVKPKDHKYLMAWIDAYDREDINELRVTEEIGKKKKKIRTHLYEWVNNVPLNGRDDSINVNFFRYQIISRDKNGEKITYKNSWITDLEINKRNVAALVRGGRCHWKIENECFNTLKNQGYHIEHNYGHGEKNLCFNFFLLTLLAFFFHQIFELTDKAYQACRKKFGSKRNLWETLRSYIRIWVFEKWEHLLDFALTPRKYNLFFHPP